MQFRLVVDGDSHQIETDRGAKGIRVRVDGAEYRIRVRRKGDAFLIRIGTKLLRVRFEGGDAWIDGARYPISISGFHDELASRSETAASGRRASLQVRAPMPGRVVRVLAERGARVKRGQTLVVLEAMKMQNEIPAPRDGIEVRLGPKWRRVRLVGRTALTDDATHEIEISEIEDEPSYPASPTRSRKARPLPIHAPMPGRVVRVEARPGIQVKRGDTLLVLEAMKMQNEIAAPQDGIVKEVRVVEGDSVIADQIVAVLEAH